MRLLAMTIVSLLWSASSFAQPTELVIQRAGSQPSTTGPADQFTGAVRVDPLFPARDPGHTSSGSVTFEPGARSAWHTHPLGQILVVTAGVGRCSSGGVRSRRSGQATSSGFRHPSSTGTAPHRRRP